MEIELKSCPNCGSNSVFNEGSHVACSTCDLFGPLEDGVDAFRWNAMPRRDQDLESRETLASRNSAQEQQIIALKRECERLREQNDHDGRSNALWELQAELGIDDRTTSDDVVTVAGVIRAHFASVAADREPEPGETIAEVSCPCCGADLDVHHGEDEGMISVSGSGGQLANTSDREPDGWCDPRAESRYIWNNRTRECETPVYIGHPPANMCEEPVAWARMNRFQQWEGDVVFEKPGDCAYRMALYAGRPEPVSEPPREEPDHG